MTARCHACIHIRPAVLTFHGVPLCREHAEAAEAKAIRDWVNGSFAV